MARRNSVPSQQKTEEKRYNHPPQTQVRFNKGATATTTTPSKLPSDDSCSAHVGDERPLPLARIYSLVYFDLQTPPRADPGTLNGGGCCWYGGSSMLRSRLVSSSPPHSAGTGRSEHHSSPCTRGKPAPGKHPATSTTRSPGQLAQPRPSTCEVPMPDQTQDRGGGGGGGGITRTKVDK